MTQTPSVATIGNGKPLVLLHGWGWHTEIWQPLIPTLAQYFQVISIDLPGFGQSAPLTNRYTLENIAISLLAEIKEPAIWLGWSLGGMLAWWIARYFPEKVRRLITVATSPKFVSDTDWPGTTSVTLEKFSAALIADPQQTLKNFLDLQLRGSQKANLLLQTLPTPLYTPCALQGGLQLLKETDLRAELANIRIPSLHIFGHNDVLVPVTVVEKLQPLLNNGQCHIIKRAGHMPFLSHPEEFLRLILGDE